MSPRRPFTLTRRAALKAGAATALGLAAGCDGYAGAVFDDDVEQLDLEAAGASGQAPVLAAEESELLFPLGVASGFALDGRPLVWGRVGVGRRVRLDVWREDDLGRVASVELPPARARGGAFARVRLPELEPGVWYSYAFVEEASSPAARSRVGRLRAPFAPDDAPVVTLGAVGCTEYGQDFGVVDALGARDDLDAVILLGDTVYSDDAPGLAALRGLWHATLGTEAYRKVRAGRPVLAIWDDHEFENDFSIETVSEERFLHGSTTFFESLPLERYPDAPDRLWRSHRFGSTVEVFLLDARSERFPSTRGTREETLLSPEQMEWLKQGLADSPATFKLIVTGVPISEIPVPFGDDRWPGYPAQRADLLRFVEEEVPGALFLAGDVHMPFVGRPSPAGQVGARLTEVAAGCGAKGEPNPLAPLFTGPQFDWAGMGNNYGTLRFDPGRGEVRVVHRGPGDALLSDLVLDLS